MVDSSNLERVTERHAHMTPVCQAIAWNDNLPDDLLNSWRLLLARLPEIKLSYLPEWSVMASQARIVAPWRVLRVTRGDWPLAIIPLCKRSRWSVDVLGDCYPDMAPVLVDPTAEGEVWNAAAQWLQQEHEIGLVSLGRHMDPMRLRAFAQLAELTGATPRLYPVSPKYIIPLPASWEEYLAGIGASTRANIRRLERQLTSRFRGGAFQVVGEVDDAMVALDGLMALHRRRWRHIVSGSVFDSRIFRDFYRRLFRWAAETRAASMATIRGDDRLLAALTLYHVPGQQTAYVHYIARDLDQALPNHFSAGLLLYALAIRWCIEHGLRALDLSYGNPYYKTLLGGEAHELHELILARSLWCASVLHRVDAATAHLSRLPRYLGYLPRHAQQWISNLTGW